MPYRRLPNTDTARLRALETAINKSTKLLPSELAFSQKTLQNIRFFLPSYKQSIDYQKEIFTNQISKNTHFINLQRKTRIHIIHFIQAVNMAIMRKELPEKTREYFGLTEYYNKAPSLSTDREIKEWGEKIIEGESKRIRNGEKAITNPRIIMVKIIYEKFIDARKNIQFLKNSTTRTYDKAIAMRKEADKIILTLWNEIEENFDNLPPEKKREKAKEYGIIYVDHKDEPDNKPDTYENN